MTQNSTQSAGDSMTMETPHDCSPSESTLQAILQFAAAYRPADLTDGQRIRLYMN